MAERIPTRERLAKALEKAGASPAMIRMARVGAYDDFESNSPTPIQDLVRDLNLAKLKDLAKRAMDGEFDSTSEEAESWYRNQGNKFLG